MTQLHYASMIALLFIGLLGCEDSSDESTNAGLGCFCTSDEDCSRGVCEGSTCSLGGIECLVDEDCGCGACFTGLNGVSGCMRTCDTAEQCYDIELCSVYEISKDSSKDSDSLYYHWCVKTFLDGSSPNYPRIDL